MKRDRKRILYLTGSGGGVHDELFLAKLRSLEPDWATLLVTTDPTQEKVGRAYGLATVFLNPEGIPYDDWDRKDSYPLWERLYLRACFRSHRRRYREILRSFRPHVVHSGWLQTESLLAASEKDCPLVVMEWGTDILIRPFDNRRNYRKTRFVLSRADLLVCDAQIALEKEFQILGHRRTRSLVIPWGVDRSVFHPGNRPSRPRVPLRIVVVKNLIPVSRLETLVEAAGLLHDAGDLPFVVEIFGDGVLREALEKAAWRRGVGGMVRFRGRVPRNDLAEVLQGSDLYVSCNESEGTSVAMMEAMACGVLPVVTRLPAYEEWVTHGRNGFLFGVGDAGDLARGIAGAAKLPPESWIAMREEGFRIVERSFDWDRNFGRLFERYEELASLSPLPR